jgi:glycerol kinase
MPSQKVIVALDLGTTGNRAVAFSADGTIVAQSYRKHTQHFPQPGWVEHDPAELFATAYAVLKEVIDTTGPDTVEAIGITNQRETSTVWERSSGKPLYNAIVWQDRRTAEQCHSLATHRSAVKEKTGLFIDPYFSATKIAWILDTVDRTRTRASNGEILFGTPETWVLWNLTKGKVHATDPSNASRTMLYNIRGLNWDPELLELFNVPGPMLPQVLDSDSHFGVTDPSLFGRPIPVHGMIGDQQSSLFGQLGWDRHTVKATYGTGIFILRNTETAPAVSDTLVSTIAWKTKEGIRYALEGSLFMGGASVQWLQENLGIIDNPKETAGIALKAADNEGVYFVPAFQGLGAPYWAPEARALIIGLSRKANRTSVIRAALESMAFQVRDIVEEFNKATSEPVKVLKVDGGASNNEFIMQFQADLLGVNVVKPRVTETTALGAAAMAGIGCGFWDRTRFASTIGIERTYTPSGDKVRFDRYYAAWKEAVSRSLGWTAVVE